MDAARGAFGLICLLLIALAFSEDRRAIRAKVVVGGVALQALAAVALLKFPPAVAAASLLAQAIGKLNDATTAGTSFVFGYLGGAPLPFKPDTNASTMVLAFRVFPLVLVICALASLMFHWGVMQRVVGAFAFLLQRATGLGGAVSLGAAVNVFVGMVEAPLLIRPYLATMERGELFVLMTCGMAGIAGTVMAVYGALLIPIIPNSFSQILTAALISAPAAVAVASIIVPFAPRADKDAKLLIEDPPLNALDAIARGTSDGVVILANILAFLIVVLALVSLTNMALGALPDVANAPITLQRIFGLAFRPAAFLIGIDRHDLSAAARLLSTKAVINEFVAYVDLAKLTGGELSAHSRLILTYALCGFANFGSVGIMVGGMCAMAPQRKHDIIGLGFKAMFAGTLASLMSGALIGALT